jgi:hypothetical protein
LENKVKEAGFEPANVISFRIKHRVKEFEATRRAGTLSATRNRRLGREAHSMQG